MLLREAEDVDVPEELEAQFHRALGKLAREYMNKLSDERSYASVTFVQQAEDEKAPLLAYVARLPADESSFYVHALHELQELISVGVQHPMIARLVLSGLEKQVELAKIMAQRLRDGVDSAEVEEIKH